MKQEVIKTLQKAFESLKEQWGIDSIPDVEVEVPRDEKMGDFATTAALKLTKTLKKSPGDIASEIVATLNEQSSELFESIDIAEPGFINFRFNKRFFYDRLKAILEGEGSLLRSDIPSC